MNATKISWTKTTWNPVHGCSRISEGCAHCYAEKLSLQKRFTSLPWTAGNLGENLKLQRHKLREPLRLDPGTMVFVNSMSDLFLPQIPTDYVDEVFGIMRQRPDLIFQVLTKRPRLAAEYAEASGRAWPPHVWIGATVENQRVTDRIDALRDIPARVRFVSAEPLLGALPGLDLTGIAWVIVGGESGGHLTEAERAMRRGDDPRAVSERWMDMAWARGVRDACVAAKVAYFFKQDSGLRTELRPWLVEEDGSRWTWHQWPGALHPPELVSEGHQFALAI